MLLLLLLCPFDDAKHSDVQPSQHGCVHVCKGTISIFLAFEANRCALQHSKDGLQIIVSTSASSILLMASLICCGDLHCVAKTQSVAIRRLSLRACLPLLSKGFCEKRGGKKGCDSQTQ